MIPFFFHPHLILLPSSPFIMQRARQPKEQYTAHGYPLMSVPEIAQIFNALGIAVQPEDLAKPSAAFVQTMYAALLDALMGAPMDMLENPKNSLLGMMEYKVGSR